MLQRGRERPALWSASATSAKRLSAPDWESASICLSQAAASNSAYHRRNSLSSFSDYDAISRSIFSTFVILDDTERRGVCPPLAAAGERNISYCKAGLARWRLQGVVSLQVVTTT